MVPMKSTTTERSIMRIEQAQDLDYLVHLDMKADRLAKLASSDADIATATTAHAEYRDAHEAYHAKWTQAPAADANEDYGYADEQEYDAQIAKREAAETLIRAQAEFDAIASVVAIVSARFAERQGWDVQLGAAAETLIAAMDAAGSN